jgi:hypothetical protein
MRLQTGGLNVMRLRPAASSVNFFDIGQAATTKTPYILANGSDTNVAFAIQTQGTGAIDLAAGSSGVNISNGGTVTAITRTSAGSLYTSIPSTAITAPTTAGGVTSTVSVAQMQIAGATIAGGGTGYTVGNTLTIVGGTPVSGAATLTVTTVSAGVITGVSIAAFNNYTALPTNPVSVTGGSGSGATFNLTWAVISFTITNAGSGYIEQPTITFSGGGGSGAAAYATVGGNPTIRSLGTTLNFTTPTGGTAFAIVDTQSTGAAYWTAIPGTGTAILRAVGSSSGQVGTSSGVPIQFTTSGLEQMRIAHTASAVNYVQVTGSATGGNPAITVQGSDGTRGLAFSAKGNANINFFNNNLSNNIFVISGNAGTIANYLQATASVAGTATSLQAQGTDTNIDLALTPKGTGNVRFGTYTANMAVAIQGYIEIKDSGGTIRRLAVVT